MTDYRSLYSKDYLGAWDLTGDKVVTIVKCIGGELTGVGGRKSRKPLVYFEGIDRPLALNSGNGKTIASLYGKHVEKWAGMQLTLYKSVTNAPDGSGEVDCVRIRPDAPQTGPSDDDILEEITELVGKKKYDEALDLARSIRNDVRREKTVARINEKKGSG